MPGWIIAAVMAGLSFFFAGDVYLWLFSGRLENDRWGFASAIVNTILPYVDYVVSLFFGFLAYTLYQRRKYRILALTGDHPDWPLLRHLNETTKGEAWRQILGLP